MNVCEAINKRRSIRKYKNAEIPREILSEVLDAGRLAPSAKNMQTWNFTVIENPEIKEKLAYACGEQMFISEAPAAIVIWSQDHSVMRCGQARASVDLSCALSFMMLRATELGLGTCWIGMFYADKVKELLKLPEDSIIVAITPIGYPDEAPKMRHRKDLEEISTFI